METLRREKGTGGDEECPGLNAIGSIQPQNPDGRASGRCQPNEEWSVPPEVPAPLLPARVEETNHPSGHRIYASQVAAFEKIAVLAGPSHIAEFIGTAVFPRDDVLKVERKAWQIVFVESAILAAVPRSTGNQFAERGHH